MTDYSAILKKYMYHDTMSVSRQTTTTDDIGADVFTTVDVVTDAPCQLSQFSQNGLTITEGNIYKSATDLKIYAAPTVDVRTGDVITVKTAQGQTFTLTASRKFSYMTHCEIVVSAKREVTDET